MSFAKRLFILACAAALSIGLAYPQATTGSINGSVRDATGSAVPGAEITVTNQGSEQKVSTTSSDVGSFIVPALTPGFYEVRASLAGFKAWVARDLKVDVGKTASILVTLEVGELNQTITVVAGATLVDTSQAQISNTVSTKQILDLPLNGRNPLNLITMQAGTSYNGRTNTSFSGTRTSYTSITQDGVNIQDNFIRSNATDFVPNRPVVDQVAEFTITTQNQGTEAGFGTSQVNLVTPSGTNDLHGSVYWFHRNDVFAANSFFNNKAGVPKDPLIRNQFGARASGPIIGNKLFFFGFYEGQRQVQSRSRNNLVLLPDARQGIFTYTGLDGQVRKLNILQTAGVSIDPVISGQLGKVPTTYNNFDTGDSSAAQLKNNAGYYFSQKNNNTRNQTGFRIDYNMTERHSIEGVYNFIRNIQDRPDIYAGFEEDPKVKTESKDLHFFVGAWKWTVTPTMLNEVRLGGSKSPVVFNTTEDFSAGYKLVLPSNTFTAPVEDFERQGRKTRTYTIQDNASWQSGAHSFRFGFQSQYIRVNSFTGFDVTTTIGLGLSTANNVGLDAGDFPGGIGSSELSRANNLLAALGGFQSTADKEYNVTSKTSGFENAPNIKNFTYDTYAFYFGDTWRIRPRVSLNAGVRWEYYSQLDEEDGLMTEPVLKSGQSMKDAVLDPNGSYDFVSGRLIQRDLNNFAPNVGLAWDIFGDGRTSLRAGYGISYANDEGIRSSDNALNRYGVAATLSLIGLTNQLSQGLPSFTTPEFKLPLSYQEIVDTIDPAPAVFGVDPHLRIPYVQTWNFGLQREVASNIVLEARYVGTKGTRLGRGIDFNQVIIRENGLLDDTIRARSNGFLALAAGKGFDPRYNPAVAGSQPLTVLTETAFGGLLTNSTIKSYIQQGKAGQLAAIYQSNGLAGNVQLVPNPTVYIADVNANGADSIYHGMQLEARRRFESGLYFQFNYTFSKVLTNASGVGQTNFEPFTDLGNLAYDRGRAEFDTTQIFNGNFIYELPVGRGKRFHIDNSIMNKIVGGWQVTSILQLQTGPPFSIRSARGTLNRDGRSAQNQANSNLGTAGARHLLNVGDDANGPYFISRSVVGPDGRAVAPDGRPFFDGQAFWNPGPGTMGSLPKFGFNGPSYINWDFGLIKRTSITEETDIEFRAEFFNFPNHNSFYIGDQDINSTQFGRLTSSNSSARVVQFGVRINF